MKRSVVLAAGLSVLVAAACFGAMVCSTPGQCPSNTLITCPWSCGVNLSSPFDCCFDCTDSAGNRLACCQCVNTCRTVKCTGSVPPCGQSWTTYSGCTWKGYPPCYCPDNNTDGKCRNIYTGQLCT